METIIHVDTLRKTYKDTVAVDGISFDIRQGEIFGMVGPNGAGKTTTIECLEGLRQRDSGDVRVLGVDPWVEGQALCLRVGMQLQQSNLPDRMKVWEALDLYASFYPNALPWETLMEELGLAEKRDTYFSKLSGGQKQRLFIALALLPDPQLVFLDELTTGLDPQARHAIWDLIREVRTRGKTIFLTTHFMEEAERLCDRVAILDRGKIAAIDTPEALIHSLGIDERVIFTTAGPLPADFTTALTGPVTVDASGDRVVISSHNGRSIPLVSEVVSQLGSRGIVFRDLRTEQPTLEDVFLSLTGDKMRE